MQKSDLRSTSLTFIADHSHCLTVAAYLACGKNALGLLRESGVSDFALDGNGRLYATLGYANGPGYRGRKEQPEFSHAGNTDPDFLHEASAALPFKTHG